MSVGALIGALFGLLVMSAVTALIGAVILRAAISLYNSMVSPESSVPETTFGNALLISFVTMIVNFGVGLVIGLIFGAAGQASSSTGVQVVSIPASFIVMGVMLQKMLPTTFGRALLLTFCQLLIWIVIGIVVAIIAAVVM